MLVEGEQRISVVIKYLTQSTWSHVAVYIGDEMLRRFPERREELEARFGPGASELLVEALMEGVVLSPLSKYLDLNIRLSRPYGIRKEDLARVLDQVIDRVGFRYDVRHVIELAFFLFPVSLVPKRFRKAATLPIGSGEPNEVICSRMIADAFHAVGFPILPRVVTDGAPPRRLTILERLHWRVPALTGRYLRKPSALVTPRDFDLSPYFEIVKFNYIESTRMDYRKIPWSDDDRDPMPPLR